MKSYTNLFEKIISPDNLHKAFRKAILGKRKKSSALRFQENYVSNIMKLHRQLLSGEWRSGEFNEFYSRTETKLRLIQAPSFIDRIVHHAIMNICLPIFEKSLISTTFACIKGRGNHRAVLKVKEYAGLYSENDYVLQIDIHKFFPSVDKNILFRNLSKLFREKELLNLFKELIFPSECKRHIIGLPIGSLTSQVFANFYLTPLDHYIKEDLHIKHYVRYMDDLILFFKDKYTAWDTLDKIGKYLQTNLNLELNPNSRVYKLKQGIDFAGYRTFKKYILPRKRNLKNALNRFKKFKLDITDTHIRRKLSTLKQQVSSFLSYIVRSTFNYFNSIIKTVLKPILNIKEVNRLYEIFKIRWRSISYNSLSGDSYLC